MKAKLKTEAVLMQEGWVRGNHRYGSGHLCFPKVKEPQFSIGSFETYNLLGKEVEILEYVPPNSETGVRGRSHGTVHVRLDDYVAWLPPYVFEGVVFGTKRCVFDKRIKRSQRFRGIDEKIEFYGDHFRIGCRHITLAEMRAMVTFVRPHLRARKKASR